MELSLKQIKACCCIDVIFSIIYISDSMKFMILSWQLLGMLVLLQLLSVIGCAIIYIRKRYYMRTDNAVYMEKKHEKN